jgi:hypothetical protein
MFLRAEEPFDASAQAISLYMYTPDLMGLSGQLSRDGVRVPGMVYPESMPSGEVRLADPDGYTVLVVHRGRTEQEAWEKRIGRRA